MTWPAAMTTCTVTIGQVYDSLGNPASLSASVALVLADGLQHLVFSPTSESITAEGSPYTSWGDQVSVAVPHCNQSGIVPPSGMSVTGVPMAARITVKAKFSDGTVRTYNVDCQPLVGTTGMDLDPVRWEAEGAGATTGVVATNASPLVVSNAATGQFDLTDPTTSVVIHLGLTPAMPSSHDLDNYLVLQRQGNTVNVLAAQVDGNVAGYNAILASSLIDPGMLQGFTPDIDVNEGLVEITAYTDSTRAIQAGTFYIINGAAVGYENGLRFVPASGLASTVTTAVAGSNFGITASYSTTDPWPQPRPASQPNPLVLSAFSTTGWSDRGIHPSIAAKASTARPILSLARVPGTSQVLMGYGDFTNNVGPVDAVYLDIAASTFGTLYSGYDGENIHWVTAADGTVWAYTDDIHSASGPHTYLHWNGNQMVVLTCPTTALSNATNAQHGALWVMVKSDGTRVLLASAQDGGSNAPTTKFARSTDDGATWTADYVSTATSAECRVGVGPGLFWLLDSASTTDFSAIKTSAGDGTWSALAEYRGAKIGESVPQNFTTASPVSTVSCWPHSSMLWTAPANGEVYVTGRAVIGMAVPDKYRLIECDENILVNINPNPAVGPNGLYAIAQGNTTGGIVRFTDNHLGYLNAEVVASLPEQCGSILVVDQTLVLGGKSGHIWTMALPS